VSYEGLGKQWINGPGFIKWLEEMRPESMYKPENHLEVGGGGRVAWASAGELKAMWKAECRGEKISLENADNICVKLGLHIDMEMPPNLWIDDPSLPPPRRTASEFQTLRQVALSLFAAGYSAHAASEKIEVDAGTVRRWFGEFAAEERAEAQAGWLAGLEPHATQPGVLVRA
jgi:hypothetical protein